MSLAARAKAAVYKPPGTAAAAAVAADDNEPVEGRRGPLNADSPGGAPLGTPRKGPPAVSAAAMNSLTNNKS